MLKVLVMAGLLVSVALASGCTSQAPDTGEQLEDPGADVDNVLDSELDQLLEEDNQALEGELLGEF